MIKTILNLFVTIIIGAVIGIPCMQTNEVALQKQPQATTDVSVQLASARGRFWHDDEC